VKDERGKVREKDGEGEIGRERGEEKERERERGGEV